MQQTGVPTIDVGAFATDDAVRKQAVARLVDEAFTGIGFMTIIGHGVPRALMDEADQVARTFFALPVEEKLRSAKQDQTFNRGYIPFGAEAVGRAYGGADSPPDLKEAFVVGRPDAPSSPTGVSHAGVQFAANLWPAQPAEFSAVLSRYYGALEQLAFRLLRVYASALRLEEEYFLPAFTAHNAVMRVQHYPAQAKPPLPGQLRIAPHTDYGAFTILKGDSRAGGLQVLGKNGAWVDVVPTEDSFVINIGDLMMTWTNDRWRSNVHRVVNPSEGAILNIDRLSIPFFVNPNYDALIECLPTCREEGVPPRHSPILAGEHRMQKLKRSA